MDEADEMLNKGFHEQIYDIYRYLPPSTQVVLVSATLPHDILEMTHKFIGIFWGIQESKMGQKFLFFSFFPTK